MALSLSYIAGRLQALWGQKRLQALAGPLDKLAPVSCATGGAVYPFELLSMVCHRDIDAYILAARSFIRWVKPQVQTVVDDGSLSDRDRTRLVHHFPELVMFRGEDFKDARLPDYSSWQRIQAIAARARDRYVIQLDADTLTVACPSEVIAAIEQGRPFLLGTDEGLSIGLAQDAQLQAKAWRDEGETHIQNQCECVLDKLPQDRYGKYVRACAGFSGYPQASITVDKLVEVSNVFSNQVASWKRWGSEQVTSNVVLSNLDDALVLPVNRYDSVENYSDQLSFVHFIGNVRFRRGYYQKVARSVLAELAST